MKQVIEDYCRLLEEYLNGSSTGLEWIKKFLKFYGSDNRQMDEELYNVLDVLWGEVESYQPDEELYRRLAKEKPGFFLNESLFHERAEVAYRELKRLSKKLEASSGEMVENKD